MNRHFAISADTWRSPLVPSTAVPSGSSRAEHDSYFAASSKSVSPSATADETKSADGVSLEERLYNALAAAKMTTAKVAMHLSREWRDRLFRQLDSLLAIEDWDRDDLPLQIKSFVTFLRTILFLRPRRAPGLGISSTGYLVAAWTKGDDRLTMEFGPNDRVVWTLSCVRNGGRERAAGETDAERMNEVLAPYRPDRWFEREA